MPGPFPEDLPDPGIEAASLMSPALAEFFSTSAIWEGRSLSTEVYWVTQPKKTGICLDQSFPAASGVKNPPAKQETPVQSLGGEDPLDREVATHCSILAWKMLYRGAWWATVRGVAGLDTTEATEQQQQQLTGSVWIRAQTKS